MRSPRGVPAAAPAAGARSERQVVVECSAAGAARGMVIVRRCRGGAGCRGRGRLRGWRLRGGAGGHERRGEDRGKRPQRHARIRRPLRTNGLHRRAELQTRGPDRVSRPLPFSAGTMTVVSPLGQPKRRSVNVTAVPLHRLQVEVREARPAGAAPGVGFSRPDRRRRFGPRSAAERVHRPATSQEKRLVS